MKKDANHTKLNVILQLPQFEKVTASRKNAKHIVLEEKRIVNCLKKMKEDSNIDEDLF